MYATVMWPKPFHPNAGAAALMTQIASKTVGRRRLITSNLRAGRSSVSFPRCVPGRGKPEKVVMEMRPCIQHRFLRVFLKNRPGPPASLASDLADNPRGAVTTPVNSPDFE